MALKRNNDMDLREGSQEKRGSRSTYNRHDTGCRRQKQEQRCGFEIQRCSTSASGLDIAQESGQTTDEREKAEKEKKEKEKAKQLEDEQKERAAAADLGKVVNSMSTYVNALEGTINLSGRFFVRNA